MKRLILLLMLAVSPALAVGVDEATLDDPAQETRARGLMKDLRCLVCQNQSIEDSNADMARDLRNLVRERIALGDTDEDVHAFLVERYGDWILMKPPFNAQTALLWLGPIVLLLGAGLGVVAYIRRQRTIVESTALSEDEAARLHALLKDDGRNHGQDQ